MHMQVLWLQSLSTSRRRLGSQLWHLCSYPGLFALILSSNAADREKCFRMLLVDWMAYNEALLKALGSPTLQKAVRAHHLAIVFMQHICLLWFSPLTVSNEAVMNKLVALAHEVFQSLGRTKIIEYNFQRMRAREDRDVKNKKALSDDILECLCQNEVFVKPPER